MLQKLGDVEKYFHDAVAAVEERIEDGRTDCDQYSTRLLQLYHDILSCAGKGGKT